MVNFIVSRIEKAAKVSVENGQAMYRSYMIDIDTYAKWKTGVDTKLRHDGYEAVIVEG